MCQLKEPHFHILIKLPSGKVREIPFTLLESDATIHSLHLFVSYDCQINQPFLLFWKGKCLKNPELKLSHISVDGEKLPLYKHNLIVVCLESDIGPMHNFEGI
jgi:hypothetical protein